MLAVGGIASNATASGGCRHAHGLTQDRISTASVPLPMARAFTAYGSFSTPPPRVYAAYGSSSVLKVPWVVAAYGSSSSLKDLTPFAAYGHFSNLRSES